ncbi:MAG TPA: PAS domain S-box protein [Baekduia sp.]|nr:PAS domain S-box protein [Baekduia sp.]
MKGPTKEQVLQLFELSLDLLVIVDPELRVVAANPSWERILGYPPESLVGGRLMDLVHPDDVAAMLEGGERLGRGLPAQCENRYRHADGHWVVLFWSSVITGEDGAIYATARDVTEERRAVADAAAAIARLEAAQSAARMGSWELDLRTGARFYTRYMYALHGLDPDRDAAWDLRELLQHVLAEYRGPLIDASERVLQEPGPQHVEYRVERAPDRILESVLEAQRDDHGTPTIVRGTVQDITELRENERRLAEAERLACIGSFEWRMSDAHLVWSAGTYPLFERDPSEGPLDWETFLPLVLPYEAANIRAELRRAGREGTPWEVECSMPTRGGPERKVLLSRGEAYCAGDETYVRGTIQDVTQQRRFARQQQEIARLGQLALAGTDLKELFDEVCRVVIDQLGTDMANVLAVQGDGSPAGASSRGLPDSSDIAIPDSSDSIVHHALADNASKVVTDWLEETRFPYSPRLKAVGVRCTAVVPVRGRDGPFGVLTTHALRPGIVDPEHNFAFLEALASFLATAIERLRHEAEIAALATLRGRLVAENLEAEERVRQRISEQLHDGALQDLLAARQDLVEASSARDDGTRAEMLRYARQGVERAVKLLRQAVHALHPVVLQHGGLEAAMQAAVDQAARQGSFRAEVAVDPAAAGLRDELVLSVARELLNNAARHAEAEVVQVTVARQDGMVLLEVSDDGRGPDRAAIEAAPMHGHIGLASMAQRVEAVGGTLDLQASATGQGTTVLVRLPID